MLFQNEVLIIWMFMAGLWVGCYPSQTGTPGQDDLPLYNFDLPSAVYNLPEELMEISGNVMANPEEIYCIQDEKGIVYTYNLKKKMITRRERFADDGDFEDLTLSGEMIYILRSDSRVYVFRRGTDVIHYFDVNTKSANVEGLFFYPRTGLFYLASKAATAHDSEGERRVFTFSAGTEKHPEVQIKTDAGQIAERLHRYVPVERELRFHPSAIAFHPVTGDEYILSAKDRLLAVYRNEHLIQVYRLPERLYYQPEGICFAANGDLYLSSEGDKKHIPGKLFYIPCHRK